MSNLIDNPLSVVGLIFFIILLLLVLAMICLIRIDRREQLGARDTRRRMAAERDLNEEKKAHAETTRVLKRQRLICNNCPRCNPGGDPK